MNRSSVVGLTLLVLAAFCASPAMAAPIAAGDRVLLDYGYISSGATDSQGRTWNTMLRPIAGQTNSNLVNTAGQASTMVVWWGWSNSWAGGDSTLAASATDYPSFAYNDRYQNTPTTPGMCELQGLNKALTYDITVYGSRGVVSNDRVMEVTIGGVSQSYNGGGTAGEGSVTFKGVAASDSGVIRIDFVCTQNYGYLNVIDVTAVPEPGTMVLAGTGCITLLIKRWRKLV